MSAPLLRSDLVRELQRISLQTHSETANVLSKVAEMLEGDGHQLVNNNEYIRTLLAGNEKLRQQVQNEAPVTITITVSGKGVQVER